jgi:hypothetical protein
MSSFSFRPSFSHTLDMPPARAVKTPTERLRQDAGQFEVNPLTGFICLRLPVSERHFWTPRLMLGLESAEGDTTLIRGSYGPNANVWSLYLYGYLFIGTGAIFSGIFGFCQWQLGMTAWGLWIFWTLAGCALAMYLVAQMGQKLASTQAFRLHQTCERASGRTIAIH